jgi:hypothetical protein
MSVRHLFGVNIADYAAKPATGIDLTVTFKAGATVTFWNAQTDGTAYNNLATSVDGSGATDHTTTSTGADGYDVGSILPIYGPPDVLGMWASADGGPRRWVVSQDLADVAKQAALDAANALAALETHAAANNPHQTALANLIDVAVDDVVDGELLAYDLATGKWIPVSGTGLNPADFVSTAGGSQIRVPDGNITTRALQIFIPAGDRGPAPPTMSVWFNAGTDLSPNWQETTRFNEFGEARFQASRFDRVAARTKQVSSGQTGNLHEWVDNSNGLLSWVGPNGLIRAKNLGAAPMVFSVSGAVNTGIGAHRIYNDTGATLIIRSVRTAVGTAPTGAALVVDVNKNGSTIFSTQTNRPSIAASGFTATAAAINDTVLNNGDYLTVDVDQVGSTVHGSDLTVAVWVY